MTTSNREPKRASPPERYRAISHHRLRQAQEELDRGDLAQASEKIWGATVSIIKAVAQQRGWNHHAHNYLQNAAFFLTHAIGRDDLHLAFLSAEDLHSNYYEHQLPKHFIEVRLGIAQAFVEELSEMLDDPQREFIPDSPDQETLLRSLTRQVRLSHGPEFTAEELADLPPVEP